MISPHGEIPRLKPAFLVLDDLTDVGTEMVVELSTSIDMKDDLLGSQHSIQVVQEGSAVIVNLVTIVWEFGFDSSRFVKPPEHSTRMLL